LITLGPAEIAAVAGVGLLAGVLGGLLGIGGSVVMIPGLAILFHQADPDSQHLYQGAAMAANVAVSAPAAVRHYRAGTVRGDVLRWLLPVALVAIVSGVLVSNLMPGLILRRTFAVFLLYVGVVNINRAIRGRPDNPPEQARVTPVRCGLVGLVLGFAAGVLGIGGGIIAIPVALVVCRLPLRQCIGVSSAAMCLTATIGASLKIGTLGQHEIAPATALLLAATLAPTAIGGGWFGASLTHRLPLQWVRAVLIVLLFVAAWRMWQVGAADDRPEASPPGDEASDVASTPQPPSPD